MQFRAEQYYRAGLERMEQARKLYLDGSAYSLAMYCGGLAVESLLRAFRWTEDASFEGRHDLADLLQSSRLLKMHDDHMRRNKASEEATRRSAMALQEAMQVVINLWHNNLRFASEAALKSHLKRIGKLQGVKGDPLKKNTLDLLDSAQTVMDQGVTLWISKTGSSKPSTRR